MKKKLKKIMIDKDIIMKQLAEATGTSTVHVSNVVNGKSNASIEWWKNAAEFLGVDISEIIE